MSSAPRLMPSSRNCTPTTALLSDALALTATAAPDTVEPSEGAVTSTDGAVVSLSTVTSTAALVALLPAASRATAVSWCGPFDTVNVFQTSEYGALVSSTPRFAPSNLNCTPTTATLSEALAVTLTLAPETVAPFAGAVTETVGGSPSMLFTVTPTGAEVAVFPTASRATAVSECGPLLAVVVSQFTE